MIVGIISNSNLTANNATTFQAKYPDASRVRDAIAISAGIKRPSNPRQASKIITTTFRYGKWASRCKKG